VISDGQRAQIRRYFYAEHWKIGTIAAELDLHRDAVALAVGTDAFTPRAAIVRPSMLDPHRAFVAEQLAAHPKLLSTRLFEMIRARDYRGSVVQLRRLVARTRPRHHEAYLRIDTLPGEQAQADWASFGRIQIGRAHRRLSLFVMVHSWSRAIFARFTRRPELESFLRCHHQAFVAFGGVPRQILYDNLKSVVRPTPPRSSSRRTRATSARSTPPSRGWRGSRACSSARCSCRSPRARSRASSSSTCGAARLRSSASISTTTRSHTRSCASRSRSPRRTFSV